MHRSKVDRTAVSGMLASMGVPSSVRVTLLSGAIITAACAPKSDRTTGAKVPEQGKPRNGQTAGPEPSSAITLMDAQLSPAKVNGENAPLPNGSPLALATPTLTQAEAPACTAGDWNAKRLPPLLRSGTRTTAVYDESRDDTKTDALPKIVENVGEHFADILGIGLCEDAPSPIEKQTNQQLTLANGVNVAITHVAPAGKSGRGWYGNQCAYHVRLADGSGKGVDLAGTAIPPFTTIASVLRKGSQAWIGVTFNGYAVEFPRGGCFVVAVDLCEGRVVWKSENYTSNAQLFLIGDDYLITGYGFTKEKRIIQVRDAHSGRVIQTQRIPGNPEQMFFSDGQLSVQTNHGDVSFTLTLPSEAHKAQLRN